MTELRGQLIGVRRDAIPLRRYLAPQRDALSQISGLKVGWLDDGHRARLRESGDRVTRFVEDLDSMREEIEQQTVALDDLADCLRRVIDNSCNKSE